MTVTEIRSWYLTSCPFIFEYCKACRPGWWIGLRTRLLVLKVLKPIAENSLTLSDELPVLCEDIRQCQVDGKWEGAPPKQFTLINQFPVSQTLLMLISSAFWPAYKGPFVRHWPPIDVLVRTPWPTVFWPAYKEFEIVCETSPSWVYHLSIWCYPMSLYVMRSLRPSLPILAQWSVSNTGDWEWSGCKAIM